MKNKPFLSIFLLLIVMALWGGSFIAIKVGLRELTPMQLVTARFVPSALMLLPVGWYVGRRSPSKRNFWQTLSVRNRWLLLLSSFLAVPGYHTCLNYGETMIPAGWASLVISLNPACIALFAALLLHERIGLRRWGGVGLAFCGLLFIGLTGDALSDSGNQIPTTTKLLGLLITFGAVVSWGLFTVLSKQLIAGHHPVTGLTWTISLGAIWTLPWFGFDFISRVTTGSLELWGAIIFLSLGCTVFSFIVWFRVLSEWQASRAGVFIYLVPLLALIFGWLYLDETLSWAVVIGALGVLGGVVLAATQKTRNSQT